MHTLGAQTKTQGEVRIHYNSDWSGNVIITFDGKEFEIPGEVLLAVSEVIQDTQESLRLRHTYEEWQAWKARQEKPPANEGYTAS